MARVLVVDDEPAVLQLLSRGLAAQGHEVLGAPDGRRALELVRGSRVTGVDLVVSDILLPGIEGPELVREISKTFPGVPALFISGHAGSETLPVGTAFLPKPFSLAELFAKVDELLQASAGPRIHLGEEVARPNETVRHTASLGAKRRDVSLDAARKRRRINPNGIARGPDGGAASAPDHAIREAFDALLAAYAQPVIDGLAERSLDRFLAALEEPT